MDQVSGCVDKERLSQLELENKALREMLEICSTSKERILPQEIKVRFFEKTINYTSKEKIAP